MGRLAVVLGSSALGPGGETIAAAAAEHGAAIVQRHDGGSYAPLREVDPDGAYVLPHEIDHQANLQALVEQGCDRVLAIASVGSLDTDMPVGSLLCPDDFIALHLGLSTFADERAHRAPRFDPTWRKEVIAAWRASGGELRDGGVYWQAIGPRFETPAEIRLMAAHADVVGMTIASECIVAAELGLAYAAVCVVDNLANGIGSAPLEIIELEAARAANALQLHDGLAAVLPRLGAVGR
ncbi:MAG TPA: MTAP family purine nucleoside phosphorylase [Solirubrobacterales bacterium]|nr:MTAP family purine nucleoside phosphorylase [Solirubrobacterales bacterium]